MLGSYFVLVMLSLSPPRATENVTDEENDLERCARHLFGIPSITFVFKRLHQF